VAFVSDKNGQLAAVTCALKYGPGLSLWNYFVIGVLGIAIGYSARLVVDSLNALPNRFSQQRLRRAVAEVRPI